MSLGWLAFLHFPPVLTSFEKGLPPRDNFLVSSNTAFGCSLALGLCYNFTLTLSPVPCFCTKAERLLWWENASAQMWKLESSWLCRDAERRFSGTDNRQELGCSRHRKAKESGQCFHTVWIPTQEPKTTFSIVNQYVILQAWHKVKS